MSRYFAAQGYDRIVVAGPRSTAAASGAAIVRVADLPAALGPLRAERQRAVVARGEPGCELGGRQRA